MSEGLKFNSKGGKNYKRNKTNRVRVLKERAKIDVDNGDGYYGTITKMCGCDNVTVQARADGELYRVQIPGRMYNRGGSKNRLKVGDEVLVLGPLDKNVIGVIEKAIRTTDIAYGEATRSAKKSLFEEEDEEDVDDTYDELLKQGRRGEKMKSHKGGEKMYSTEEELIANLENIGIQKSIADESEESSDENIEKSSLDISKI